MEFSNDIQSNGGLDDYDEQVSDSKSCVSSDSSNTSDKFDEGLFGDELIKLNEDAAIFDIIGQKFLLNLVDFEKKSCTTIKAIHKMNWSYSQTMLARAQCFNIFRATVTKNNDNCDDDSVDSVDSCMKYAWYCGSKEEIQRIVSHGFGHHQLGNRDGICFAPINSLAQSVGNCVVDDDGLKHVLLCRVLVENGESLNELSSGVVIDDDDDDVISPNKYIVWSTKMNTHILPEYVVTFRTVPCLVGIPKVGHTRRKPIASPWLPFTTLISAMSNFLPPRLMNLINGHYKDFKEGKISRRCFIQILKRYVGSDFLIKILNVSGVKGMKNSLDFYSRKGM